MKLKVICGIHLAVAVSLLAVCAVNAADRIWDGGAVGDWDVAANWSVNTKPIAGDTAIIRTDGATVTVDSSEICHRALVSYDGADSEIKVTTGGALTIENSFRIGKANDYDENDRTYTEGTLTMDGGTITTIGDADLQIGKYGGVNGAHGYFNHSAGTVTTKNVYVGAYADGTYNISGTAALNIDSGVGELGIGYGGVYWKGNQRGTAGIMTQSGSSSVDTHGLRLGRGWDDGSTGIYNMEGGTLNAGYLYMGILDSTRGNGAGGVADTPSVGVMNQSGGTVTVGAVDGIYLGVDSYAGSSGTYNYTGGTLTDGTNDMPLVVRFSAGSVGTFRGRGTVDFSGLLRNNGQVIADGGVLDLTGFTSVTNNDAFGTQQGDGSYAGWYAVNGGRLDLPGITVSSNGSYNCGEAAGDVTNDLVNSVQMTFSGVMGTGTFSMAVLDPTNSVSAPPSDDWTVCLGIWDVTNSGFTFESVDASFCYDTVPLGDLPEGALRLYQYIDAEWVQVTTAVDADNNRALVAGIDSLSPFAVAWRPLPFLFIVQ